MLVTKRNGKKEEFSKDKIFNAISLANESTKYKYRLTKAKIHEITDTIAETYLEGGRTRSVEVIQDMIEEALVDAGAYGVAKAFITYRYKSDVARNFGATFVDEITKKLSANDIQNQNANVDEHSFGGRMGEATEVLTKKLALENLVSPLARKNHEENMIYIHDLGHYAVGDHNCLSIPFDPLLARGFNTRQTDVRPAGSVNTAGQLTAVISQLQSLQQFGGVSATHIDHTMVPYIRLSFLKHFNKLREFVSDFPGIRKRPQIKVDNPRDLSIENYQQFYKSKHNLIDKLVYKYALKETEREVYQAAEGLFHNLNTLQSRSGCQLKNTVAGC